MTGAVAETFNAPASFAGGNFHADPTASAHTTLALRCREGAMAFITLAPT